MPTLTEVTRMGAVELARLIAARELSSREVVDVLLARIEEVNPRVNALRVVLADEARAAADAADRASGAGGDLGPLHGVPFTIKENLDLADTPTTSGIEALKVAMASRDAPSVAGLRGAGAIPLGRSNLAEFGFRWHSWSGAGGHTVNPWDPAVTPGGSSGGEAAALATGMTPLGIGNDLGGSLRVPSQWNGTAALKPTFGRVGHATTVEPLDSVLAVQIMAVNGAMARRVEDLRASLGPMSLPDPRDPWQAAGAGFAARAPEPVRVCVSLWEGVHPDVEAGVHRAAKCLAEAGYAIEEGEPPRVEDVRRVWASLIVSEFRGVWRQLAPIASVDAARFVNLAFEVVPALEPEAHGLAYVERQALAREWAEWMRETPLVLAPVCARPPFAVGHDISGPDAVRGLLEDMRMVAPANALGLPAAAVAVGEAGGLPRGVQVIGPRWGEDLCLDAAAAIEAALGTITPIDPR
jgi:amidase